MIYLLISIVILLIVAFNVVGILLSTTPYKGKKTDHFDGTYFHIKGGHPPKGLGDVIKWKLEGNSPKWVRNYETFIGKPIEPADHQQLVVTFVNHSTFMIQWQGLTILTDPVWSARCSPLSFIGPKRKRPPGLNLEDLPPIDIVLLSHNHYDHLDLPTVKKLESIFHPTFIVPLGVKSFLDKHKIKNSLELDWYEKINDGITITALPAQHFSGRGIRDRNKSLWCGYLMEADDKKVYFVGDTGYNEVFKEIGKHYGPIDLALIPIGAYVPRWFMSIVHVSPQEAVKIHQDIHAKQSIGMHFGTFALADENMGQAEEELILELSNQQLPQDQFIIPEEGVPMTYFR